MAAVETVDGFAPFCVVEHEKPAGDLFVPPRPILVVAERMMQQHEPAARFDRLLRERARGLRPVHLIVQHEHVIAGMRPPAARLPRIVRRFVPFRAAAKRASACRPARAPLRCGGCGGGGSSAAKLAG